MKIYRVNSINRFDKQQYSTSFKAIPQRFVTDTYEKITSPRNKAVYEKLIETFKDKQPRICESTKEAIENAYKACLDASGNVNDYALSTLYKLCYMKYDFSNLFTPVVNTLHDKVLSRFSGFLKSWDGESELLDKTKRCRTYREKGIGQIAKILEACKDKNGNPNPTNLDFANWIEKNCSIKHSDISKFINACKNPETGICREENMEIFNDLYSKDLHYWLLTLPNDDGIITKTALKFLDNGLKKFDNAHNSKREKDYEEQRLGEISLNIVKDALAHAHGKDRDEIFELINENVDTLAKNLDRRDSDTILLRTADEIKTENYNKDIEVVTDYNINLTNLEALIECCKKDDLKKLLPNFHLLKDKNGIVNETNKECIKILTDGILWIDDDCEAVTKFKEAINNDGILNIDFCKNFAKVIKNYKDTNYISSYNLITCMEYMKNKDDTVNWEAVNIVYPLAEKCSDNASRMLEKLTMIMRDEHGDICEAGINKVKRVVQKYNSYSFVEREDIVDDIKMQEFFEKAKDINLYKADEMYSFIKKLKSKGKLKAEHFSIPIDENGNTLLMYIADIPQNAENKQKYEQILKILESIPKIDYNQQDKFGITIIEKVINSENIKLLNHIKNMISEDIKYNPMLDYAVEGVKSQSFKKELKNLSMSFPELEEAVRLNSAEAFDKVKKQLDSQFFNRRKEAKKLYNIAMNNKNFTISSVLKKYLDT